jgi:hypothetical protein
MLESQKKHHLKQLLQKMMEFKKKLLKTVNSPQPKVVMSKILSS